MLGVFAVSSVPDLLQRCRTPHGKLRLQVPKPDWLVARFEAVGVDFVDSVLKTRESEMRFRTAGLIILGLVQFQAGVPYSGPSTSWSREEWLLFDYNKRPLDAFTVRVHSVKQFQERHRVEGIAGRAGLEPFSADLTVSAFETVLLQDGHTAKDALDAWGCFEEADIPIINIVDPLWQLICAGQWHSWMLRRSQHLSRVSFPASLHQSLPANNQQFEPHPLDAVGGIGPCQFQDLATTLRRWTPVIRDAAAQALGEEERDAETDVLHRAIVLCEATAAALAPGRHRLQDRSGQVAPGCFTYSASVMLHALRQSRLLKSMTTLGTSVRIGMELAFPKLLASGLQDDLSADLEAPSSSTISRNRFLLDCAIMVQQRRCSGVPAVRHLMCDSSVQKQRDWLHSTVDCINEDQLQDFMAAADSLNSLRMQRQGGEGLEDQQLNADATHQCILKTATRHHCVPVALGMGAAKLEDKVAALLFAWSLECSDLQALQAFVSSLVSITTDYGTEAAMHKFHLRSLKSMLPSFMVSLPLELEQEEATATWDDDMLESTLWLQHTIPVPGAMHLLHNLCQDAHQQMTALEGFLQDCKMLELLLGSKNEGRRDRFVQRCVANTPHYRLQSQFQYNIPSLYEKRWGCVVAFSLALDKVIDSVAACWDARLYKGDNAAEQNKRFSKGSP